MEKKRNGLDNFFRENLSDFELSEKKGNWELLNHLLNEQDRKKKKRIWFFFISCFIVMLSLGLLVMLPDKKVNQKTNEKMEQPDTFAASESNSSKNETPVTATTTPSDNNEIVKGAISDVQQTKPANNSFIRKEKNTPLNALVYNEVSHSGVANNTGSQHSGAIKSEINFTPPQQYAPLNDSDKTVRGETKYPDFFIADEAHQNDSIKANTISPKTENQNSIDDDSLLIKFESKDSLTAITTNNSPVDSAITKKLILDKTRFLYFNFYAGLNIYSTSSEFSNHQNCSPIVGLEFMYSVDSNFSIGLAGLYSLQGGYHLDDTAIVTQETYFLDVEKNVSQQAIQIRKLHKLYFPLTFYYSLTKKHSLLGAIQLSYLVNTKGNYTEMNTTSGVTTETQKDNVGGYMDGIKPVSMAASLGYQFSVSKTFAFSTRLTRELTDAYSKEYFFGVNKNPSWSVQTFLLVKF